MKKYVIFLLFVVAWNVAFSAIIQRDVRIHGDFSAEKISLLQTVQHDTLILDHIDTVFETKWEWGLFRPERYKAPHTQNVYYEVLVRREDDALDKDVVIVTEDRRYSTPHCIGPYVSDPLILKWLFTGFFLAIYCWIWLALRSFLIWIHRDGRCVTIRRHRKETIASVVVVIFLTVGLGWFLRTYFFVFLPAMYLILIFLPARTWYSRLTKMETC